MCVQCVWGCLYVCTGVCSNVHVSESVCGVKEFSLGCHFLVTNNMFVVVVVVVQTGCFHWPGLDLVSWGKLAGQQALGIVPSLSCQHCDNKCVPPYLTYFFLTWVLGIKFGSQSSRTARYQALSSLQLFVYFYK